MRVGFSTRSDRRRSVEHSGSVTATGTGARMLFSIDQRISPPRPSKGAHIDCRSRSKSGGELDSDPEGAIQCRSARRASGAYVGCQSRRIYRPILFAPMTAILPRLSGISADRAPCGRSMRAASVGRSARASMVAYNGTHFTAEVPAGWRLQEAEVPKSEGVESTWRNPSNPSDALLIDASPATNRTLQQDAAPVQEQLLSDRGYDELYYGPGDLPGVGSWMWIWRISGRQRIDYFFHRCSTDFGVLGSTVVGRFIHLRAIFRLVAQSVRANCH
jgi:hypothetical protein